MSCGREGNHKLKSNKSQKGNDFFKNIKRCCFSYICFVQDLSRVAFKATNTKTRMLLCNFAADELTQLTCYITDKLIAHHPPWMSEAALLKLTRNGIRRNWSNVRLAKLEHSSTDVGGTTYQLRKSEFVFKHCIVLTEFHHMVLPVLEGSYSGKQRGVI